eukprot:scaffold4850_cov213-Pinguiococcus_pyrenoidosus.AAC.13
MGRVRKGPGMPPTHDGSRVAAIAGLKWHPPLQKECSLLPAYPLSDSEWSLQASFSGRLLGRGTP